MSERIGNLREAFDRDCAFYTVRAFTCGGMMHGPGQPFDKGSVSERRLRQLYEGRYLRQDREELRVVEPRARPVVEIGNRVAQPQTSKRVRIKRKAA